MTSLQQEGRYAEARAALSAAHPDDPDVGRRVADARARLDLVERLDDVRLGLRWNPQGTVVDYAESSRQFAAAFRSAGLGDIGEDVDLVARRVDASSVREALLATLDHWAASTPKAERDWILGVARRADPDPWRDRVRDTDTWTRADGFPATAADILRQPVALMVAFATRWRRLKGDPAEFLKRVQRQHPTDFWVNLELGHTLGGQNPEAAVGYLRAALAVRPAAPHSQSG